MKNCKGKKERGVSNQVRHARFAGLDPRAGTRGDQLAGYFYNKRGVLSILLEHLVNDSVLFGLLCGHEEVAVYIALDLVHFLA